MVRLIDLINVMGNERDDEVIIEWFRKNKKYDLLHILFKIIKEQTNDYKYKVSKYEENNYMDYLILYSQVMKEVKKEIEETNDIHKTFPNLMYLIRTMMDCGVDFSKVDKIVSEMKIIEPFKEKISYRSWLEENFFKNKGEQ